MRKAINRTVMHSYPGMVALVTADYNGRSNIMSAGWHSYISYEPPIYGVAIGRERFTYDLVKKAGCFAINFLPYEKAELIQQAGVYSGGTMDKLLYGEFSYDTGLTVNAPILHDAYIAYECRTIDVNTYGYHDWFVGEITQFYRDDSLFKDDGLPDFEKLEIPLYLGRSTYAKLDSESKISTFYIDE